jgi:hypothetical protein
MIPGSADLCVSIRIDYGSRFTASHRRARPLDPNRLVKRNQLDKTPLEGHEKSSAIEKRPDLAEGEGENESNFNKSTPKD